MSLKKKKEAARKTMEATINTGLPWHITEMFPLLFHISPQDITPCLEQVGDLDSVDGTWYAVPTGPLLVLLRDCLGQAERAEPDAYGAERQ